MKKYKLSVIIIGTLLLAACGQQSIAPKISEGEAALKELNPKNIWTHVKFLADDAMEGRDTGSVGHKIAVNYVASQFAQMGLEPIGRKNYKHPVPFRGSQLREDGATASIKIGDKNIELKFLKDFLTLGSALNENLVVSAPLIFVGRGITAPIFDYDDYEGIDATGKIVVYIDGAPDSFPSDHQAHFGSGNVAAQNAADHGAIGTISIQGTTNAARRPWKLMTRFATRKSLTWVGTDGNVGNGINGIDGSILITNEIATKLFEASDQNFEEVYKASHDGNASSFDLNATATIGTKSKHTTLDSFNVISVLEGSDPALKDEYVIYTAHLDHIGMAHGGEGDLINNGAYDNATGVGIMLETARVMAMPQNRPKRSVIFAAVTAEEKGLLGSAYLAKHPPVSAKKIIANVNIDMPILSAPSKDVIAWGSEHSTLQGVVERAAIEMGLYLAPDPWPEQGIFTRSDQYAFVKEGIPAVMLAPGIVKGDGVPEDTVYLDKFLSSNYHKPSDDINQPFDLDAAARFSAVNYLIGVELANSPEKPKWLKDNFFGDTFAKDHDSSISD